MRESEAITCITEQIRGNSFKLFVHINRRNIDYSGLFDSNRRLEIHLSFHRHRTVKWFGRNKNDTVKEICEVIGGRKRGRGQPKKK